MAFNTYCTNRGCMKQMDPVLDKETNEVICTECGKSITSITEFAKRQMISLGQIRRASVKKQAWSVKCTACKKEGPPKLNKEGERDKKNQPVIKLLCQYCEVELTDLNRPFAETRRGRTRLLESRR